MADLFSMFGLAPEPVKEEKKAAKKTEKKAAKKTEKATKVEKPFKLPLTIVTAYREPLTMEKGTTDTVKEVEVKKYLEKAYPEYSSLYTILEYDEGKSMVYAGFSSTYLQQKGEIELSNEHKLSLGGVDFDFSSVLEDETSKVSFEELSKALSVANPVFANCGVYRSLASKQMALGFTTPELTEEVTPTFPLRLVLFGRESWEISEEEYKAFVTARGNEGDAFSAEALSDMVTEKYPELDGHVKLLYDQENQIILVTLFVKEPKKVAGASSTKKEELYPTEGVSLSFVFKRIELSPDMFGGKKEVTKKELQKFAGSIYPEYDNENTQFVYSKEKKMITAILVGSRKGAATLETVASIERFQELALLEDGTAFHYVEDGTVYRVETTPVSLTVANDSGEGTYIYRLPKMPGNLLRDIYEFFKLVAIEHATEVLVRVYYDDAESQYVVEVPRQQVTGSSVHTDEPLNCALWPVMDIHSHCAYDAFYSATDNADEIGNRIYGVIGKVISNPTMLLRAGTGGKRVMIREEDVFDLNEHDGRDYYQELLEEYNHVIPC